MELILQFAKNVAGADVIELGKVIIASKNPYYNYAFAKDVPGADIKAHGQAVVESGNSLWNYQFARDIPLADIASHQRVIMASGDIDCFIKFESEVMNKEKPKILEK